MLLYVDARLFPRLYSKLGLKSLSVLEVAQIQLPIDYMHFDILVDAGNLMVRITQVTFSQLSRAAPQR